MTHPPCNTVIKNPTWWRRRTRLERALLMTTGACLILVAVLIVAYAITSYQQAASNGEMPTMSALSNKDKSPKSHSAPSSNQQDKLCLTDGCIEAAWGILENMDKSTEPCDDFYQFACGKFRKKFIPDDKTSLSSFSIISDRLQEQLRSIVDSPVMSDDIPPIVNAKNIYKLCMNESRIEEVGAGPVKQILKELGGWPVLEGSNWDEGGFSWKEAIYRLRKKGFGIDYFIDFSVSIDSKNSSVRIIELDQAAIGVSREYLIKGLSNKRVKAYFEYMVDIAILFGANPEEAKKQLRESLDFEIELANISLPTEERRDANKLYNRMTITELQNKFPTIPWMEYITNLLPPQLKITENEPIIVGVPTFITQLEQLLQHRSKRVVGNYVMWRAAASTVSYLPDVFRRRQLKYIAALTGSSEREARWKECSSHAARTMSLAVGSMYVKRYFKDSAKTDALDLVQRIREEMYKIIKSVEWMDDHTRAAALDKAHAMTTHIAYPEELLDTEKLTNFYRGLEMNADGLYVEAVLNSTRFSFSYSFGRLRDRVNKTEWISHGRPAIVNAFYSPIENSIQFPAGILQGVFFSDSRPKYLNYGAIGFVIGHEITHGFDDQGRQFDKDGNLVEWWDPTTKAKYLEKATCIIEQYGNYTDSQVNMKLNGINTQGENIADNGGIKEAYYAYKRWAEENGQEPHLPGFQNYSPQQMFWLSAASVWCSTQRDETLSNRITTGFHSPGEFRVIGPLSNMPDFSKDWNCPLGSKMNPEHKCSVW